jgi:uncharacterized membrane protein
MSRWLLVSILLTALVAGASLVAYFGFSDRLPERVPIHWNIQGEPDGYVSKDGVLSYLLMLPGAMALITVLAAVLPWLSPRQFGVERFRATFDYVFAIAVAMLAYMQALILVASFQQQFDMTRFLLGGMFLFLAALGNVLGKVQRNFWMGVRTPWTLASETVWIRTHRLAAWLFTGGALIGLVGILAGLHPVICFSVFGVAAIVPVFYSLFLYKKLEREGRLDATPIGSAAGETHEQSL